MKGKLLVLINYYDFEQGILGYTAQFISSLITRVVVTGKTEFGSSAGYYHSALILSNKSEFELVERSAEDIIDAVLEKIGVQSLFFMEVDMEALIKVKDEYQEGTPDEWNIAGYVGEAFMVCLDTIMNASSGEPTNICIGLNGCGVLAGCFSPRNAGEFNVARRIYGGAHV